MTFRIRNLSQMIRRTSGASLDGSRIGSRVSLSFSFLARVALTLSFVFSSQAYAASELSPQTSNPKMIQNAVGIYITQNGEAFFSKNLRSILANLGISLREGYFPEVRHISEKPMSLDELAESSPEAGRTVLEVRKLLQDWFMGLVIHDPQFEVTLKNAGYRVAFSKLSIRTNRNILRERTKNSGAVLVLETEVNRLALGGEAIHVRDLQNEFLKNLGVVNPVVSLTKSSRPLRLRVPFFFDVHPDKGVQIEVLPITTNFAQTDIAFEYDELIVPDLTIEINGQRFPLNKSHMTRTFEDMKPQLIAKLKTLADELSGTVLPEAASGVIASALPSELVQSSALQPPGAPENETKPHFAWTMKVNKVALGSQVLGVELESSVEDPTQPEVAPNNSAQARGRVSLAGSDPTQYEMALSVNRGLINRILQLSYSRGYFSEVEASPGKTLKMFSAPMIDTYLPTANQDTSEPKIVLRVGIQSPVSFIQKALINGDLKFYVDIVGRLVQVPGESGLRIQLDGFDEKSVHVLDSSLTWLGRKMRSKVVSAVLDELRAAGKDWKKEPMLLDGNLPLPPELLGLKTKAQAMRMDKNGHLVMFLNFEK